MIKYLAKISQDMYDIRLGTPGQHHWRQCLC